MPTQAEYNQIAVDNRDALISIQEQGKLQSELTNQTSITDSTEFLVIQKGTDDANKVSIPISRGSLGDWNASSNDPSLVNGTGVGGDKYIVTVAGTQDFGDGSIEFLVDDFVEYISGEWKRTLNTSTGAVASANTVIVNAPTDFPTAVANVITLVADTTYRVSTDIDIGADRFDTSEGNITLVGANPNTDTIQSSTTGALFTGSSIRLENVGVTVTSGSIFNMSGLGVISLSSFFVFGCVNIGTVDATGLLNWRNSNITAITTSGLLFTGICRSIIIQDCSFSNFEGVAIDLGTATASLLRIDGNRLSGNIGSTSLDVAPSSANIIAEGQGWLVNCLFNGDGTHTVGTASSDTDWTYHDNVGVPNSFRGADGHILGNATATVIATISTPVAVNFNSSFIADVESSFTVSTAGCFTYTGSTATSVNMTASVYGDSASGTNVSYRFYFAKNNVVQIGSVSQEQYDSSDPHSTPVSYIDEVENGDEICLWVENITNTTNITVETASIHIIAGN